MSRQIDLTDLSALSDEDKQYLRDRGQSHIVKQLNELAKIKATDMKVVEVEEVDEPYSQWKFEVLQDELRNRDLSDKGKKADLVARLEADDASAETE